jgi:hypothetical protein
VTQRPSAAIPMQSHRGNDDVSAIDGSDLRELADLMHRVGIDTDVATLIEATTGVVITREILEEATFTSGSVPLPYW